MAVRQAIDFENKLEGLAGRGRFAAAARILSQLVKRLFGSQAQIYLILKVIFCVMLKKAQIAMIAQTPYQKFLAYMFPSIWNWLSSKISPRNIEA
jgi:hypothetical protein